MTTPNASHCSACGPVPSDHHHCAVCEKPIRYGEVWVTDVVNGWPWPRHRDCRPSASDPMSAPAQDPDKRRAWLRNSLRAHAKEERAAAARCRRAYRTEPCRSMAHELAEAHDEAAVAFERRLAMETR